MIRLHAQTYTHIHVCDESRWFRRSHGDAMTMLWHRCDDNRRESPYENRKWGNTHTHLIPQGIHIRIEEKTETTWGVFLLRHVYGVYSVTLNCLCIAKNVYICIWCRHAYARACICLNRIIRRVLAMHVDNATCLHMSCLAAIRICIYNDREQLIDACLTELVSLRRFKRPNCSRNVPLSRRGEVRIIIYT